MSSPALAAKLLKVKMLEKKETKTEGFKRPTSFTQKLKKGFRNHPLFYQQKPSTLEEPKIFKHFKLGTLPLT